MTEPVCVLLMDDNEMLADAMQRFLSRDPRFRWSGWVATRAELFDALALADRRDALHRPLPDLILMDVDMPGTDAFALARELGDRRPDAKVVMFSGHVRREYADAAVDAGAYGYLSKDDDLPSICDALLRAHAGEPVMSQVVRRVLASP